MEDSNIFSQKIDFYVYFSADNGRHPLTTGELINRETQIPHKRNILLLNHIPFPAFVCKYLVGCTKYENLPFLMIVTCKNV